MDVETNSFKLIQVHFEIHFKLMVWVFLQRLLLAPVICNLRQTYSGHCDHVCIVGDEAYSVVHIPAVS